MNGIEYAVVAIYTFSLLFIFLFALSEFALLLNYIKFKKSNGKQQTKSNFFKDGYPPVTIQLPIYNEFYIVEKLLDNIAQIDYPGDLLEIQVLDDSTDETVAVISKKVEQLNNAGINIKHIHRTDRAGFKAGALKEGLTIAQGKYIAIFDSDFLPEPDWLIRTLPHFYTENIGAVQTKWGHINRDYSFLTKVQAFALDIHFTMEQVGRNIGGHFINFNGTAGVWRKECILDAGNWRSESLTEDLDLSYRAQLKGWKMVYLENVETPAELPIEITAAKSQQFRWNKGGAENFRMHIVNVIRDNNLSFSTKLFGIFHLLSSSVFVFVFLVALLSVWMLVIKLHHPEFKTYFILTSSFILSTIILFYSYWKVYANTHNKSPKLFFNYVYRFFSFFTIALGFSLHNTIAVIEGWIGKKSPFVRTPKFNIKESKTSWRKNKYLSKRIQLSFLFEGILSVYFAYAVYLSITMGSGVDYGLVPMHLMLSIGYGWVFIKTVQSRLLN